MKIKVKDLEANPYRNIAKYPIDRAKVDALKTSIKETTFWDNILVRPHPKDKDKYQIAYGHHRHIALKELELKEVDIPVRKLTDAQMLKIMAEENLEWSTSPAVIIETVLATKIFLDAELAKCETPSQFNKSIKLVTTKSQFDKLKQTGVGQTTILKFLGGNWKQWVIQNALHTIKEDVLPANKGGIDREAIQTIPTMEQASVFRRTLKNHHIPKPTQRRIAKKIRDEGIGKRDIPETVREIGRSEYLDVAKKPAIPMLDELVGNMLNPIQKVRLGLIKIKDNLDNIQSPKILRKLLDECAELMKVLNEIKEQSNDKKVH